jgi:hypothetical protein
MDEQEQQKTEERSATSVMIFAAVSSVIVVALIGAFLVFVASVTAGNTGGTHSAMPYDVAFRPVPVTENTFALFPEALGRFQRTALDGTIKNFRVTYASGSDLIRLRGSEAVSVVAAQASVRQIPESSGQANTAQFIEDSEPGYSYYLNVADGLVRFAWSHERWFFDIQATSKSALDDFMKMFEY